MARPVSSRSGQIEFLKLNTESWEWRDTYQWLLALSWPRFIAVIAGIYVTINVIFATLYATGGPCIDGMAPGSFPEAFFFSVQTLATVGYGHMFPATIYGHFLTVVEIISGMFWLAVMTGLIFVRFSRPSARIVFSNCIAIAQFNGVRTLMLRVGNSRQQSMIEAEFRITFSRDEPLLEGGDFRYFYPLKLHFDRLPTFPAALTLRHEIDEESPLHGETAETLQQSRALFMVSVIGVDPVIPAAVQTQYDYTWRDVHFDEHFVEIYTSEGDGKLTVDFARLHDTQPATQGFAVPNDVEIVETADGGTRTGTGRLKPDGF